MNSILVANDRAELMPTGEHLDVLAFGGRDSSCSDDETQWVDG